MLRGGNEDCSSDRSLLLKPASALPFAEELMTKFRITVKNGSIPALYENSCLRCMESMQVFRRLKRAEDC
jgi:hypothetical protein